MRRKKALTCSIGILALLSLSAGCVRREAPKAAAQEPAPVSAAPAERAAEEAAIRYALHQYVDSNEPSVQPDIDLAQISINSGYALVSWMHGEEGGQAVLRKRDGTWTVLECGQGWLGLRGVCHEKVPVEVAKQLLDELDPNWVSYEAP